MLKQGMRNIHPGEILREEVINAYSLNITEGARLLGITRQTLSNILNEKADITPEMALRIATVFGGTPNIWLNLQVKYDLQKAEKKVKQFKLIPYRPGRTA